MKQWQRLGDYAIGCGQYTVSKSLVGGSMVYLAWRVSTNVLAGNRREMPTLLGAFSTPDEAKEACK